ncbi:MAG: BrnT family toxin [Anaerolineae bacterium]|nr:BrnT family toxin [Anaerolineae bacterium]
MGLLFEWDENKARENLKKHKRLGANPFFFTLPRRGGLGERKAVYQLPLGRRQGARHSHGPETLIIRIISCRNATTSERRTYEQGED